MGSASWDRREFLLATALLAFPATSAHAADDIPPEAWNAVLGLATSFSVELKRRTDRIAAGLSNMSADAVFTSIFGSGVSSVAERKKRTAEVARDLSAIAFEERTRLLPVLDAYIAAPTDANWQPVRVSMNAILTDLYELDIKFDRLRNDAAISSADSLVVGKTQMIRERVQSGRPMTPASLAAFKDFRSVFESLVTQKGRLADQLGILANAM